ncbi:hypothetical protein Q2T41_00290 [Maribacter confluentis]|uniref:Uncharacterized protein n=1 Tax=Maribacter confluentis TaxID=1656093 RepID=A0ABT8RJ59_9FLAO|nr:hypothetical protein [Maribacter confluentis]MDO1511098.1 hypothetical protein [Maribacter confluentis]
MKIIANRIHLFTSILLLVITSCAKGIDVLDELHTNNSVKE